MDIEFGKEPELPELPCEAWYASERWLEHAARQVRRVLFWTDDEGLDEELKAQTRHRVLRLLYDEVKPLELEMASLRALLVHTRNSMTEFELRALYRSASDRAADPLCVAVLAAEHALLSNSRIIYLCSQDFVQDTAAWANHIGKPASRFLREGVDFSLEDFRGSIADSKGLVRALNAALTSWFERKRSLGKLN